MQKRLTIQRALVLEAVRKMKGHVTADEVYDSIAKSYPDISKGTVYRNLNLLSDMGEIRRVEMPSGADRYDHRCYEHYHAKCTRCGQIFDVDMEFITDLGSGIKNTHGFQFTGHDIMFKGICSECNK